MKKNTIYTLLLVLSTFLIGSANTSCRKKILPPDTGKVDVEIISGAGVYVSGLRKEHPRMFLNKDMLPDIRLKAQGVLSAEFQKLKREVDELPLEAPVIMNANLYTENDDGTIKPGRSSEQGHRLFRYNGGDQAVKAALVYLITEDPIYLAKAINYIKLANHVFQWTAGKNIWVDLTGHVRINALTAYDWICSELSTPQRRELLLPMLDYISKSQPNGGYTFRRTIGDATSGNYGERALEWFAGLAGYGDGIDDARTETMLKRGKALFIDMMDHREEISAGSGLLSSSTVSYSFFNYPYSSFHFLHTYRSAFNQDATDKWRQMLDFPNWFDWAALKLSSDGRMLFHGIGDLGHTTNTLRATDIYTHMAQVIHFYSEKYPHKMEQAYALQSKLPNNMKAVLNDSYPFLPFILTKFDPTKAANPAGQLDYGKYFYNSKFGLLLMRSGKGAEDTYASFRFGSDQINHQHYDDLSFVIYKKNFLALDGGSRTEADHHHGFAPQSVAHNTILIHEPNEPLPDFWKAWSYVPDGNTYYNHGGQNYKDKGVALALHSTEDFVYAAGDGTKNYSSAKSREVVRQFVYLKPNIFVVYDRVASAKKTQKKEFLIRFQEKPQPIGENGWRGDHESSLFVTTLLPKSPVFNLVGGSGREFEASGRNWELPGGASWDNTYKLTGKWRLEVSDEKEEDRTVFLHVMQATLSPTVSPITKSLRQTAEHDIVDIVDEEGNKWEISFNREGTIGAHIRIKDYKDVIKYEAHLDNSIEVEN